MDSPSQSQFFSAGAIVTDRRTFLRSASAFAGLGALGLTGCYRRVAAPPVAGLPFYDAVGPIPPIRVHEDRVFRTTVCLRPFRAAGPRLDAERVGDKLVVHNYGHGGSGWSLSWGSSGVAVRKALTGTDARDVAVLGCGALGLTSASLLQREGVRVTIYAKERPPFVRSSRATGSWTPDSRIALASGVSPTFAAEWESMARSSFAMYQSYLGLPGNPVEWTDRYALSDESHEQRVAAASRRAADAHDFLHLQSRIADITPGQQLLPHGATTFPTKYVYRSTSLTFNVADYAHQLLSDFLIAGGKIETREFHSPTDLAALPQNIIINCTGYGARALWGDESITPVRGQITWLIPQEGVTYGVYYGALNVLGRRDGIVVQLSAQGEETGWNDTNESPDPAETKQAIQALHSLYDRMAGTRTTASD